MSFVGLDWCSRKGCEFPEMLQGDAGDKLWRPLERGLLMLTSASSTLGSGRSFKTKILIIGSTLYLLALEAKQVRTSELMCIDD